MDRIARIAPSARLEQQIEELLTTGFGEAGEHLAELGRLGARLVLQRAVDEEVAAFLGRAPLATSARRRRPARATGHGQNQSRQATAQSVLPCPRCATLPSASSVG